MQKVSIITVNYNHSYLTNELLHSIATTNTYPNIEIIVVDNGSIQNPVPQWQQQFPQVQFFRSEKNVGFAGGNNLGIQAATGNYFFLVNNDTEFTPHLIETLVNTFSIADDIGVVCPQINYYHQKNIIQYVGYTPMNYYRMSNKQLGQYEEDKGQYKNTVAPTGFAHGAAMMVSKAAVNKAGLMAENFFLYYEEGDWCERIHKAGFGIWINTQALIYHKESISVGKKSALKEYYMNRNRLLYIRRNANLFTIVIFFMYFIFIVVPRNIVRYIQEGNAAYCKQLFLAIWWNFTNRVNSNYLGFKP